MPGKIYSPGPLAETFAEAVADGAQFSVESL